MWNSSPLNSRIELGYHTPVLKNNIDRVAVKVAVFWGLLLLFLPQPSVADIYTHIDENQVVHLTNVPMGSHYKVLIREKPFPAAKPVSELAPFDDLITWTAGKYEMDCALVKAVIKAESSVANGIARRRASSK